MVMMIMMMMILLLLLFIIIAIISSTTTIIKTDRCTQLVKTHRLYNRRCWRSLVHAQGAG